MSEEHTRDLTVNRSFEDRIFARFDVIDARFDAIDGRFDAIEGRLESLETQAEQRALETKPIWERALAEILEVRLRVDDVARKIDVLSRDVMQVRADELRLENRLDRLDAKPS